MPCEEYSPLQQLLLEPELASVKALSELIGNDRVPLATSLLRIFRNDRRETELLRTLCQAEIARESDTNIIFRGASLATTLMDLYMRTECGVFLKAAVLDTGGCFCTYKIELFKTFVWFLQCNGSSTVSSRPS
jgi:Ras GTPase-activating protein 1